jgi:hypothetical protein
MSEDREPGMRDEMGDLRLGVRVLIVGACDVVAVRNEPIDEMRAHEARLARNEKPPLHLSGFSFSHPGPPRRR